VVHTRPKSLRPRCPGFQVGGDKDFLQHGNLTPDPSKEEGFVVQEFDLDELRATRLGWAGGSLRLGAFGLGRLLAPGGGGNWCRSQLHMGSGRGLCSWLVLVAVVRSRPREGNRIISLSEDVVKSVMPQKKPTLFQPLHRSGGASSATAGRISTSRWSLLMAVLCTTRSSSARCLAARATTAVRRRHPRHRIAAAPWRRQQRSTSVLYPSDYY
jgi:hypothetical protein